MSCARNHLTGSFACALAAVFVVSSAGCAKDNSIDPHAQSGPKDGGQGDGQRTGDTGMGDRSTSEVGALDGARGDRGSSDGEAGVKPDGPRLLGPIRVATLNVRCLLDNPDKRIALVATELQKLNVDAVALQEVCESIGKGGTDNFAKSLAAKLTQLTSTDWTFNFAPTHDAWKDGSGKYQYREGVGLIARLGEVSASNEQTLPVAKPDFVRKVIWAKIETQHGSFYLYSTTVTRDDADPNQSTVQPQAIVALAKQKQQDGVLQIIAGDFGKPSALTTAVTTGSPAFTDTFATKNPGDDGFTTPAAVPTTREHYIFSLTDRTQTVDEARVVFSTPDQGQWPSAHRGVFAVIQPK